MTDPAYSYTCVPIVTWFSLAENGSSVQISAGELNSGTQTSKLSNFPTRLALDNKAVSIYCDVGEVCSIKGGAGVRAVSIEDIGGDRTTLSGITIKDADQVVYGAGLHIKYAFCTLVRVTFSNNKATKGGAIYIDTASNNGYTYAVNLQG